MSTKRSVGSDASSRPSSRWQLPEDSRGLAQDQYLLAQTLADASLALTSHRKTSAILDELLVQAKRIVPYTAASIALLQDEQLHIARWEGYDQEAGADAVDSLLGPLLSSPLISELLASQRAQLVVDTRCEAGGFDIPPFAWLRACLVLPIRLREHILGLLQLHSPQPGQFTQADAHRLEPIASAAAIALENARLLETAERRAAKLDAVHRVGLKMAASLDLEELFQAILHSVFELVPDIRNTHIFLYEDDRLSFAAARWADGRESQVAAPRQGGLTYKVARTARSIVVTNMRTHPLYQDTPAHWSGRIAGLPLMLGDEVVGVMNISGETPRPWTASELRTLRLLGDQAAVAIRNARLYRQAQQEIAERRRVSEKVRQLSRAVEQSPASIVITDPNGNIEYVNPKFSAVSGYTAAEVVGRNPRILKSGHTSSEEYRDLWQTIKTGREWRGEFLNRRKDGSLYWEFASISPILDDDGQVRHLLAIKEDITERKAQEEEIRLRNEALEFLNALGAAINQSATIKQILATALEHMVSFLGVDGAECNLLDDTDDLTLAAHHGLPPAFVDVVATNNCSLTSCGCHDEDNSPGILYVGNVDEQRGCSRCTAAQAHGYRTLFCLPLHVQGAVLGTIVLYSQRLQNFTAEAQQTLTIAGGQLAVAIERASLFEAERAQRERLQALQAHLIQSEKLAAVGELVGGVAHELNNPLGAVILYAQLMQRKGVDESVARHLERIVTQAQRASSIVQSLLEFARQRPPERRRVQVNELLVNSLELMSYELKSHNIEVQTDTAPDLPLVLADPQQLQQVFVNLIGNAYQAMAPAGSGQLTITTEQAFSHYLNPQLPAATPVIRIRVTDNGPGIPPEIIPRIFDPFFTTKEPGQGSGLGLSVCHGILSEHEGHIWAESTPTLGASFFVELPIQPASDPPESPPLPRDTAVSAPGGARILIIDDEPGVQAALADALSRAGYSVDAVGDAESALPHLENGAYDLLLCDVRLPGMSGLELYGHLADRSPTLVRRMLFVTGAGVSDAARRLLERNGVPFLVKPFSIDSLLDAVETSLARTVPVHP